LPTLTATCSSSGAGLSGSGSRRGASSANTSRTLCLVIDGHTVLFTSAGQLLGDLCALDSDSTLQRRLRHYARPQLLVIDEVGYLSYSNRHADMLFQLISRRYQNKSTLITTNRAFGEWNEVFPNAACVVSLVDRLAHNAEIVAIEGESYRLKEARDRADARARKRRGAKSLRTMPDHLRQKIWVRYSSQLQDLLAEERRGAAVDDRDAGSCNIDF
jgi:hypothetical protein